MDIGDAVDLHRFSQRPTAKAQASVGWGTYQNIISNDSFLSPNIQ